MHENNFPKQRRSYSMPDIETLSIARSKTKDGLEKFNNKRHRVAPMHAASCDDNQLKSDMLKYVSDFQKSQKALFGKMMRDKRFGLHDYEHPIWTDERLHQLVLELYDDISLQRTVFHVDRFTQPVRQVLSATLSNVRDDTILRIFWEEFKLIRYQVQSVFYESNQSICAIATRHTTEKRDTPSDYPTTHPTDSSHPPSHFFYLEDTLHNLFQIHNIPFASDNSSSVFDTLHDYMTESDKKINTECRVCYNKNVNLVMIHNTHACTICDDCVAKLPTSDDCPFCKQVVQKILKLVI